MSFKRYVDGSCLQCAALLWTAPVQLQVILLQLCTRHNALRCTAGSLQSTAAVAGDRGPAQPKKICKAAAAAAAAARCGLCVVLCTQRKVFRAHTQPAFAPPAERRVAAPCQMQSTYARSNGLFKVCHDLWIAHSDQANGCMESRPKQPRVPFVIEQVRKNVGKGGGGRWLGGACKHMHDIQQLTQLARRTQPAMPGLAGHNGAVTDWTSDT